MTNVMCIDNYAVCIIRDIIKLLYAIYKITPLYIKILFWIIIIGLIIWFILLVIKKINNPTITPSNSILNTQNSNETNKL